MAIDGLHGARNPGLDAAVPFRFACSRCGHCCSGGEGYVWLDPDEVEPLARALELNPSSFLDHHARDATDPRTGERRLALRERADGRCTLLEGRNTCRAYDARPVHCRTFPYWPSVMAGGAGFEAARATCPGIAVVVDPERAERAFTALEALVVEIRTELEGPKTGPGPAEGCCLDGPAADDLYMSALEADYAAARIHAAAQARAEDGCRLGPARPLGCHVARASADDGERWRARLRAIEREHAYPAAYGEARALLGARGVALGTPAVVSGSKEHA